MKFLFFVTVFALGIAAHAAEKTVELVKTSAITAAASNEMTVGVKGMVCAFCAQGIEKNFKAQKEVESVNVSLESKSVKLKFKDGQRLSKDKVAEILKDAGYDTDFKP